MITRAVDWFVPRDLLDAGAESARQARAMVGFCLVTSLASGCFSVIYWLTLAPEIRIYGAGAPALFLLIDVAELLIGRRWWRAHAGGFTLFANLVWALTAIGYCTGGAESPAIWWYVVLPMVGLSEWRRPQSFAATLCGVGLFAWWRVIDTRAHPVGYDLPADSVLTQGFMAQVGLLGAVALLSLAYEVARNQALRTLAVAGEEAVAANKAKSAFLANMSHEIRTPLTAILGFTDVTLERFKVGSEEWNWLDIVRRNGQHMLQLINDILDLSRIEADKLELENSRFSPFEMIAEVASLMRVRTEATGIALNIRFDSPLPATIETDERRVRQILINLIGNATKFTEAGSITLSAALTGGDDFSRLEFSVVDTGIGMTDAQLHALFAPFTQGDSSTSRKYGGSGLGLAISQRLAQKFGGVISAESQLGVGSTFRFSIPTGVGPEVPRVSDASEAIVGVVPSEVGIRTVSRGRCAGQRILLAEDGRDNQTLIALLLRRAGATVEIVDNGRSAVERALQAERDQEPFDVILMDIHMPEMDGHQATRALRRAGYLHRIVALTASSMAGDREHCLASGCDDYIAKPIDKDALISAVSDFKPPMNEDRPGVGS